MAKRLRFKMDACIGCQTCSLICSTIAGFHSLDESSINIKTKGGLQSKYVCVVCVGCIENIACMEACGAGALKPRAGGGVLLDKNKCIGCGKCVTACGVSAIHLSENTKRPIICKHCGTCTKYCPHGCLYLEEANNC